MTAETIVIEILTAELHVSGIRMRTHVQYKINYLPAPA